MFRRLTTILLLRCRCAVAAAGLAMAMQSSVAFLDTFPANAPCARPSPKAVRGATHADSKTRTSAALTACEGQAFRYRQVPEQVSNVFSIEAWLHWLVGVALVSKLFPQDPGRVVICRGSVALKVGTTGIV